MRLFVLLSILSFSQLTPAITLLCDIKVSKNFNFVPNSSPIVTSQKVLVQDNGLAVIAHLVTNENLDLIRNQADGFNERLVNYAITISKFNNINDNYIVTAIPVGWDGISSIIFNPDSLLISQVAVIKSGTTLFSSSTGKNSENYATILTCEQK